MEKINDSKSCFFKKMNNMDKPSARLTKKKREDSKSEMKEITTDTTEI